MSKMLRLIANLGQPQHQNNYQTYYRKPEPPANFIRRTDPTYYYLVRCRQA